MPITHTNRKGVTFYLHTGTTKTGKPRWHVSTKNSGELAESMPEGYEFWEMPEQAMVVLRKAIRREVTDAEIELVRQAAKTKAHAAYTIVDAKGKEIIIYAADDDMDRLGDDMGGLVEGGRRAAMRDFMRGHSHYLPMLRFVLEDKKDGIFEVFRWCFLGSIDRWIGLDNGTLPKMAGKYIPHLGNESFYELM